LLDGISKNEMIFILSIKLLYFSLNTAQTRTMPWSK